MEGDSGAPMPDFLNGRQALVWARDYSAEDETRCDCDMLQRALALVPGAKRMVRRPSAGVRSPVCTGIGKCGVLRDSPNNG